MHPRPKHRLLAAAHVLAVSGLLAACSTTPPEPIPSAAAAPPASWEDYGGHDDKGGNPEWGKTSGADPRLMARQPSESSAITRTPLAPPAAGTGRSTVAEGIPPAVEAAPEPSAQAGPAPSPVVSKWADGYVGEAFRAEFDAAATRAASRGLAEAEDADAGRVYAFTRKSVNAGCATVEVTVLSPGRKLPVLSRGTAVACRR